MEKLSTDALGRLTVQEFHSAPKLPLTIVLDNIRSGLNVGSVFRTADAFLVEKIYLCGITAQPPHREILKTALGSTDSVVWEYVPDTESLIMDLKSRGYTVWAIEQATHKTWLHEFVPEAGRRHALVLGNEVEGVDAQVLAACDGVIEIPQYGTKHSLNVAVAAGIAVWEFVRKVQNLDD